MPRIFVCRRLPIDVEAVLGPEIEVSVFGGDRPPSREEIVRGGNGADALVTLLSDRVDGALLDALPTVRGVANLAVGYDNVDLDACRERGVWVTNTPDVLTEATADLAFTLLLCVARRVREGERLLRAGEYTHWAPDMLLGVDLADKTLGIFGFGRIGRAVARRAEAFGMRVLVSSRSRGVGKDELLERSDFVSIHAPLDPSTRHAFDRAAFARMKRHAILINTSRGPIVDEAALVDALETKTIAGAGLDVYEHEPRVHPGLLDRDDVVLLPHVGSATRETRHRMAERALVNARAIARGERPPHVVVEGRGRLVRDRSSG
jgi:glyoxylate reductase